MLQTNERLAIGPFMSALSLSEQVKKYVAGDKGRLELLSRESGFAKSSLKNVANGQFEPHPRSARLILAALARVSPVVTNQVPGGPSAA